MFPNQSASFPYPIVEVNAVDSVTILCQTIARKMSAHVMESSKPCSDQKLRDLAAT
jgi:hypothetical protein